MWASDGIAPLFLTSAIDGGKWSALRFCRFIPGTHWIGGWVGPTASLDAEVQKILDPTGNQTLTHRSPSPYPVAILRYPGSSHSMKYKHEINTQI
jgi:hypothetical protein